MIAGRDHQRLPLIGKAVGQAEREVQVHLDEARDVLRPLDVAIHPKNRVGNAAQHVVASAGAATAGAPFCKWASSTRVPRTQVSLLPPPCELFTTIEPFSKATLVRPPGST